MGNKTSKPQTVLAEIPGDVTVDNGPNIISVQWQKVPDGQHRYRVEVYRLSYFGWKRKDKVSLVKPRFTFWGSKVGKWYRFHVCLEIDTHIKGPMKQSPIITFVPLVIKNLSAVWEKRKIKVSWDNIKCIGVRYSVTLCINGTPQVEYNLKKNEFIHEPGQLSTKVSFEVQAVTATTKSEIERTDVCVGPYPVQNLRVEICHSDGGLRVTWEIPLNLYIKGYKVVVMRNRKYFDTFHTKYTNFTLKSYKPSSVYYFKVSAVDKFCVEGPTTKSNQIKSPSSLPQHYHTNDAYELDSENKSHKLTGGRARKRSKNKKPNHVTLKRYNLHMRYRARKRSKKKTKRQSPRKHPDKQPALLQRQTSQNSMVTASGSDCQRLLSSDEQQWQQGSSKSHACSGSKQGSEDRCGITITNHINAEKVYIGTDSSTNEEPIRCNESTALMNIKGGNFESVTLQGNNVNTGSFSKGKA